MPATSRPTTRAASSAISTLSSWASHVRSIEMPPVDMLPGRGELHERVLRAARRPARTPASSPGRSAASSTLIASGPSRGRCRGGGRVRRSPPARGPCARRRRRRGRGRARATATIRPPTTRHAVVVAGDVATRRRPRRAAPRPARARTPARTASSSRRSSPTPRPWLPSSGLVTTGNPIRRGRRDGLVLGSDDLAARHRQARPRRAAGS